VSGGATFGEIFDAPPVSRKFAAEFGIPLSDIWVTPPTRARLPTAAEADDMSGRAILEALREVNEEKRAKSSLDRRRPRLVWDRDRGYIK
jgi:hypothetical protein